MSLRINVLMGGPSVEHEVSLASGVQVLHHLDPARYRPAAVVITRARELFFCPAGADTLTVEECTRPAASNKFQGPFAPWSSAPVWESCDVAFLALHGTFGEDGVIQGYLETLGLPFTGSGVSASALAMDKIASKYLYRTHGLAVPAWSVYGKVFPAVTLDYLEKQHGFPCFIKCPQSGSSRLLGRAGDRNAMRELLAEFERSSDRILVESAVAGVEFSCGILENDAGEPYALPPIEIRPVHGTYFDYTSKYTSGESEEIVPAPRPQIVLDKIKKTALAAHVILGCAGVSRTDMIFSDERLYVLETNTLPGLTPTSLLPKAFAAEGGTYAGLLDVLVRSALNRKAVPFA